MKAPLEVIAGYGCSTTSFIAASNFFSEIEMKKSEYENGVMNIIGMESQPSFESDKHARLFFLYSVQETIRAYQATDVPDMDTVWEEVQRRVPALIEQMPWTVKDYSQEGEPKLDATGKVKPKKGAKKEMAKKVYAEKIEGKDMTRKDAIAILVAEVGLTPAGASTYYANLKKGKL